MKIFTSFFIMACLFHIQVFAQFYFPDKKQYSTPKKYGLKYDSVNFKSKDGTKLHAWFIPATKTPLGTVIHFHGNAQNMTSHFSNVAWLAKEGFNVFVFDYRGYGKSEGVPSREGVYQDSVAAIKYIKSKDDINQDKLIVFGQSLGGANAVSAVAQNNFDGIKAVVIEGTFFSYRSIAKEKATKITKMNKADSDKLVDSLIGDAHSPAHLVDRISPIPLLIIHGTDDKVVPFEHSQKIIRKAKKPKKLWVIPNCGHIEALTKYGEKYRPKLVKFITKSLNEN